MLQTVLTVLVVACSALYVTWTLLLPAAARRSLAQRLLRGRWPKPVAARLQRLARESGGGCGGCGGCGPSTPPQDSKPIRWAAPPHKRQ
jgi:hypothetical protein